MNIKSIINAARELLKKRRFYRNAEIGDGFRCGCNADCVNRSAIKEHIIIGFHCDIQGSLSVDETGMIYSGNHTTIRYDTRVEAHERIAIGNHVIVSNHVTIRDNNSHPTDPEIRYQMCENGFYGDAWGWKYAVSKPVIIGDNVWIGEKAIILKGVTIGKGAIVATAAVVTHDVPDYTVVAGNPAIVVNTLRERR